MRETYVRINIRDIQEIENKNICIIGTIIKIYFSKDRKYCTLILDDETGILKAKIFEEKINFAENLEEGKIVEVFGRIYERDEEKYIVADIVREININEYILKKIERIKKQKKDIIEEIRKIQGQEGANFEQIQEILKLSKKETQELLFNLLKNGLLFEPRKGKYKVV